MNNRINGTSAQLANALYLSLGLTPVIIISYLFLLISIQKELIQIPKYGFACEAEFTPIQNYTTKFLLICAMVSRHRIIEKKNLSVLNFSQGSDLSNDIINTPLFSPKIN